MFGCNSKFVPPTMAASHSPIRMELNAQSKACVEELHAVSTMKDGPFNPKANEIRFASIPRHELEMFL